MLVALGLGAAFWYSTTPKLPTAELPAYHGPPKLLRPLPEEQARLNQYEQLISDAVAAGAISGVSFSEKYAAVMVRPLFQALSFKEKTGLCFAVSSVSRLRGGEPNVLLYDAMTNKDVGSFISGQLLLK